MPHTVSPHAATFQKTHEHVLRKHAHWLMSHQPQHCFNFLLPVGRYINKSTWTPTPQGCLYLGPSPFVLDKSFFAESVLTSYNFLASLQIIFNLENGQIKFLDNFFYLLSTIYSRQERVNDANCSVDNSGPALPTPPRPSVTALQSPS